MFPVRSAKAWICAVNMGYGHERAAFALRHLAPAKAVTSFDEYEGMPFSDRMIWQETRRLYEFVSRFKKVPVVGDAVFSLMDRFQEIEEFYPKNKGLEPASFELRSVYALMEKRAWGKDIISRLSRHPLPLVTTFPVCAFMAEYFKYPGPIVLVATDSDVARAWAPLQPAKTRILYCAPTKRVAERLVQYGIPAQRIFLTGFPLAARIPAKTIRECVKRRVSRLDPEREYLSKYSDVAKRYLKAVPALLKKPSPLVIAFVIGGAGAQADLAEDILFGLHDALVHHEVRLQIVVGVRKELRDRFVTLAEAQGVLRDVHIVFFENKQRYFEEFEKLVLHADILWTKPSELSFYAALGIPVVMAPPVGSQEVQNRKWLLETGAGLDQQDPKFAGQWIYDLVRQGTLAEAAMQGFVEMERKGVSRIESLIARKRFV